MSENHYLSSYYLGFNSICKFKPDSIYAFHFMRSISPFHKWTFMRGIYFNEESFILTDMGSRGAIKCQDSFKRNRIKCVKAFWNIFKEKYIGICIFVMAFFTFMTSSITVLAALKFMRLTFRFNRYETFLFI